METREKKVFTKVSQKESGKQQPFFVAYDVLTKVRYLIYKVQSSSDYT